MRGRDRRPDQPNATGPPPMDLPVRPARCPLAPNRELGRQDLRVSKWFKSPLRHHAGSSPLGTQPLDSLSTCKGRKASAYQRLSVWADHRRHRPSLWRAPAAARDAADHASTHTLVAQLRSLPLCAGEVGPSRLERQFPEPALTPTVPGERGQPQTATDLLQTASG